MAEWPLNRFRLLLVFRKKGFRLVLRSKFNKLRRLIRQCTGREARNLHGGSERYLDARPLVVVLVSLLGFSLEVRPSMRKERRQIGLEVLVWFGLAVEKRGGRRGPGRENVVWWGEKLARQPRSLPPAYATRIRPAITMPRALSRPPCWAIRSPLEAQKGGAVRRVAAESTHSR
jgi:hypothetical protein